MWWLVTMAGVATIAATTYTAIVIRQVQRYAALEERRVIDEAYRKLAERELMIDEEVRQSQQSQRVRVQPDTLSWEEAQDLFKMLQQAADGVERLTWRQQHLEQPDPDREPDAY